MGKIPVVGGVASGIAAGAASTLARGGSLTKNLPSITADAIASTIGNLVVRQVADASNGKTASTTNGSMSSLYGAGGNYDDLVRQTTLQSYGPNAGDQFAWRANGQLNSGSTFDATAASLELTTEVAYSRMAADNGRSIVGSSISPDVIGKAVPYPQISVRPLVEGQAGTIRNLNGLESFMAFNPLGQALGGAADHVSAMASGIWNVVTHPLDTATAVGMHYADAYVAGRLGDTVLGDVGGVLTGAVKSSPVGLLNGMYHQDQAGAAYRMGGAAVDATLFAGPSLAGPALEAGAAMFGPKLAGMTEGYLARSGGLLYAVPPGELRTVGETAATATGKSVHAALASERRATGNFDLINQPLSDAVGNPVTVTRRVDLRTGQVMPESGYQTSRPDAVRFDKGVIIDDKPIGRPISKDQQEIIRFIRAYEESTGTTPRTIAIQRYEPATGRPVVSELYTPSDFLPWNGKK